jgi:hypothetical protein
MGRLTEMFEAQKDREPINDRPADRVYIKGLLYVVAIMIIAAAAFYGLDELRALWRDVLDLVGGGHATDL